MKQTYIRFIIEERDDGSNENKGLFMAMDDLREKNDLYDWESAQEKEIYQWFKKHLKVPEIQSGEGNHNAKPKAISWFKDSAKEHIEKIRQYAQMLAAHDYPIKQLITEQPGKVLYEDEYQIAAIPFNNTFG